MVDCDMHLQKLDTFGDEYFYGVFRRGKNPSVLPRDNKPSGATIKRRGECQAEGL